MTEQTLTSAKQSASLRESLENTLIVNTIKFFSVIAKADGFVSPDERDYVRTYLDSVYLPPVADYLYGQFERFVEQDTDLTAAATQIKNAFNYENRVFILMKVYELATSDSMDDVERDVARTIGRLMDISFEDIVFIEKLYDVPGSADIETEHPTSIVSVRVGPTPGYCDIVLPYNNLDLELLQVGGVYIALKKTKHQMVAVGTASKAPKPMVPMIAVKIQHNQNIVVGDYTINFEDLIYYFNLKAKYLLPMTLYVSRPAVETDSNDLILSQMASYEDILTIEFNQLTIVVTPLTETTYLAINGISVAEARYVNLNDSITVDGCPVNLRKLAFQLGLESQTYKMQDDKLAYTIGNRPDNDIILDDGSSKAWQCRILQERDKKTGQLQYILETKGCPYKIYYNSKAVKNGFIMPERCMLLINKHIFRFNFQSGICRVEPFRFKDFIVRGVTYTFQDQTKGIDEVSFEIDYGDLVAIMGPSGCGKSTLLNIINGFNKPKAGAVEVNAYNLHKEYAALKDFMGYVPQDDLLFENLTVYENLYYNAKLRFPDKPEEDIKVLVEQVLEDIDMREKRNIKAGSPTQRTLSGGQRKRLNIGLELLAGADIYFLDEPTSGLSSKDSEKIIELLQRLTLKGKIIFVVIHQPSPKIYKMFDKLLLLDKGGKTAYFGDAVEGLKYFKSHSQQVGGDASADVLESVVVETTIEPDLLLETLEEPLRDIDGVPLGQRKYTPDYWKEQFSAFRLFARRLSVEDTERIALPPPRQYSIGEKWKQFTTLFARNFKNKVRDNSNLLITFLEAPILALAVSFILRLVPSSGEYSLFQNENLKIFIFLAVIIAMFLATTNSVDEIIKDAAILLREKTLNVGNTSYYASKFLTLIIFAIVQNALFLAVSFPVLQMRELYAHYLLFLTIVSFNGIAIGLFISALPSLSSKAAFNIVPLILIPQIIFGGALIPYNQMNHLKIGKQEIPEIAQFIPSRWAYEGLLTMQYSFNSFQPKDDALQAELQKALLYGDAADRAMLAKDSVTKYYEQTRLKDSAQFAERVALLDSQIVESQRALENYKRTKSTLDSVIEANRALFKRNTNDEDIKSKIKSLQREISRALAVFTQFDSSVAERERTIAAGRQKLANDSLRYQKELAELDNAIADAEREIERFQQNKPVLDSLIEQHRAKYQKHYGNQEIARQVRIAMNNYEDLEKVHHFHPTVADFTSTVRFDPTTLTNWLEHPLLVPKKPMPGIVIAGVKEVHTVYFNGVVLILMSVIASFGALFLLKFRDAMVGVLQRMFRVRPKKEGGTSH